MGKALDGVSSWSVGETILTSIVEAETPGVPVEMFFPDATADDVTSADWLAPGSARPDGSITFRVQAFVLEHRGRVVVVDPCVGNGKARSFPFWNEMDWPWLDRLGAAGFDPTQVDQVVHTHLHEDHFGWDTHWRHGEWVPTFPNARHVYVGDELAWAQSDERRENQDPFGDSIAPILDAGLGWEVGPDADLGDGLTLVPTPGHTPGHVSLHVSTSREPLVITGDVLHHPMQFADPSIAEIGDWDIAEARNTRGDFFVEHAEAATLLAGTHFPIAPLGRVEAHGKAWRFVTEPPVKGVRDP